MNPACEDIKDVIVAGGFGTFASTSDWGVFIALEPAAPVNCITVLDFGGPAPWRIMEDRNKKPVDRNAFQVRVRSVTYLDGYRKLDAIAKHLIKQAEFTKEDTSTHKLTTYKGIMQEGGILSLGQDDNNRHMLVANFLATRQEEQ